ncbi:MAG TPA: DUF4244 domain-containing protein [Actinocrinis sp.]|jgi:hypothetical protein
MVKIVALANAVSMRSAPVTVTGTTPMSVVPVRAASMTAAPRNTTRAEPLPKPPGRRRCPILALIRRRTEPVRARSRETGSVTAEYAIGTVVACTFAAVLYKIVTSQAVADLLTGIIHRALGSVG